MCLLKRDQSDTNCGHLECKNFYTLNNQHCVHNPLNSQAQPVVANGANFLLQNQNQAKPLSPRVNLFNSNIQQILNAKRLGQTSDLESEEAESTMLNKKKFKLKEENSSHESQKTQISPSNNTPFTPRAEVGTFSQPMSSLIDTRNLFNTQILNNMLLANSQPNPTKNDNFSQLNNFFSPFVTNLQGNNLLANVPHQSASYLQNQLLAAQNLMFKSQKDSEEEKDASEAQVKTEHGSSCEYFIKEFQTKIHSLIFTQNKMLTDLKEKNDVIQDTLVCLISEINLLKAVVGQSNQTKTRESGNSIITNQVIGNSNEAASAETLITYLYGPKPDFQYHLVLKNEFPLPLYRERNFKFTILVVDKNGNPIANSNRIPLTIGIYSSENPPKYIDVNTAGNKILKGFIEKDLINGTATFDKIQVKEVTSHFRNGWIFFVVYPKVVQNPTNNIFMGGNGTTVDSQSIKPLIIEKVIVKAKKTKEKDQGTDSPNSDTDAANNAK